MSDIPTTDWSETAASNIAAAPNGWPSNSSPTIVYDTDREVMGAIKREWDRNNPTITSAGTANAQTLTYTVAPAAYVKGMRFCFTAGATNTAAATIAVIPLSAKAIQLAGAALRGGEIVTGQVVELVYDGTQFQILAAPGLAALPRLTTEDSITAHAGGGQGSARALTAAINNVTVVATQYDSVKLPPSLPGMQITVINSSGAGGAGHSLRIFGAGTDTINGIATGTGIPLGWGPGIAVCSCVTAGAWFAGIYSGLNMG